MGGPSHGIAGVREACLRLWGEGLSGGVISERLTQEFHVRVTRCAVLGYVYRARAAGRAVARRVSKRALVERPRPVVERKAVRKVVLPPLPPLPVAVRSAEPLPFIQLNGGVNWHAVGGCAMPLNDDPCHPVWCNVPVWGQSAWCPRHHAEVYRDPR